ncbi:Major Facilitator Superfamily protein [Sanguibacter gelidistatuariae]|uniref:Major Facilitator Superfamily protein n=1 Tax=Sanguibacter gelidistatuariae TaxID=1814289 RepID=A0A1G6GSA8_9MICO|nr:MFS transporter [Sanguibacter gelidistatuariae]SDB84877.1 Major Facilitator Superfamily protein [Sanguibacter gelidistatuariae]
MSTSTIPTAPTGPRSGIPTPRRSSTLITTVLCLAGVTVSLQQTLMVPLLPDFPGILGISTDDASWLVTITLLTGAVATPIVSRLADMFGKRKMMLVTLSMMILGSLIAVLGATFPTVLVGRAFQGFGSALIPVGIAILRDELPRAKVASATAFMSATLGIGAALGLPLSGLMFEHFGWSSIFWVSAVAGVLLFVAIVAVIPESAVRTKGRFDVTGAILLSIGLTGFLLGVSKGGHWGWTTEPTILAFVVSAVALTIWFPFELRVNQPMVDLRTAARRPVLLTNIAALLLGFAMYANSLSTTQQLQLPEISGFGFGLSALTAGLCMVPAGLAMVVFSPISAVVTRRFGPKSTLILGGLVLVGAYVFRAFATGSIGMIITGSVLVNIGTAFAYSAMPIIIMRSVPITETASANGLNTLVRSIGTSTMSALVAAFLTGFTMEVAGVSMPTEGAFKAIFASAALAGVIAVVVTLFIPRAAPALPAGPVPVGALGTLPDAAPPGRVARPGQVPTLAAPSVTVPSGKVTTEAAIEEIVARMNVLRADLRPIRQAVVVVMELSGEPVDWSRTDNGGELSVVLPGAGRYLVVASADGWAPQSQVVDLSDTAPLRITLGERLTLSGRAMLDGAGFEGCLVVLTSTGGEHLASTRSGPDGSYELTLPAGGRYLLTMLDPAARRTRTRQIVVLAQSVVVDLELADPEPVTS